MSNADLFVSNRDTLIAYIMNKYEDDEETEIIYLTIHLMEEVSEVSKNLIKIFQNLKERITKN
jgi:vacuolar-type H+-ATPase subunit F/Vma7